jgi:hypothetical protein
MSLATAEIAYLKLVARHSSEEIKADTITKIKVAKI